MNIVLVGAWWTWMSGIAGILNSLWYEKQIICLDAFESELSKKLEKMGLKVLIWENKYIPQITDHVIYSEACINSTEVQTAKSYQRRAKEQRFIWNYFDFLGELSKYFTTIWVTGTNGKSTTTAMLLSTAKNHLENLGIGILGALVADLDANNFFVNNNKQSEIKNIFDFIWTGKGLDYSLIKKNILILEACEYKRHFLKIDIDWGIITNIELDHTDYYKDLADYNLAFEEFVKKTKNKVFVLDGEVDLDNQKIEKKGIENFEFKCIFGEHNQKNGTLVNAILSQFVLENWEIKKDIENFKWLWRRMELLTTTKNGAIIFSDYWHMASSIQIWYDAIKKKHPDKKITVIFQPHQINRVLREWMEFKKSLEQYDQVIVYDIFAARENLLKELKKFENLWLSNLKNIKELWQTFAENCWWKYLENFDEIKQLIDSGNKDDVFLVYSAGNIDFLLRNEYLKNSK